MLRTVCVVCLIIISIIHAYNASLIHDSTRRKRDTTGEYNAKDTIVNTLGNWRKNMFRFFNDGIKVDSETNEVTHNIHKFSRNISEVGHKFIEQVHGKGPRNVVTGESLKAKNIEEQPEHEHQHQPHMKQRFMQNVPYKEDLGQNSRAIRD